MKRSLIVLIISLLFFPLSILNAQNKLSKKIENLVFEGAGVRGIAYIGALQVLEEKGLNEQIERVGGTSAGAITALLFSLGYSAYEIEEIITETKIQKFNDGRFFFIGGFIRLGKRYGWYRGEKFSKWIGELIEQKTGNAEITFKEYHLKGYKDLYITATCLNQQKLVILSHETYPEMKVRDAVRISMSIPLYYQAVFVDSIGQTFKKQNKRDDFDIMVDGGIVGNFPIFIFDSVATGSSGDMNRFPNNSTIGLRIDSDEQIKEDQHSNDLAYYEITSFKDYVSAFYVMVIENLNRQGLTAEDWNRTVSISSRGVTPKVKRLSIQEKKMLIESGRISMEEFLRVSD